MENKNNKSSILKEAIVELQAIHETADKAAKERMIKELPEQFEKILKEEFEKYKKESVKESEDDNEEKEPENKGEEKDTDDKEESLNEMEEFDMNELSIDEIEEAFNSANETDEFEVIPETIDIDEIEDELDQMEFGNDNLDEMDVENTSFQNNVNPQEKTKNVMNSDLESKIKNIQEMLSEVLGGMNEDVEADTEITGDDEFGGNEIEIGADDVDTEITGDDDVEIGATEDESGELTDLSSIVSSLSEIAKALENLASSKSNSSMDEREDELDENLVNTHAAQRKVQGGHSPNIDVAGKHREGRTRPAMRESKNSKKVYTEESVKKFMKQKENIEKRMNSLINENKKLTKKYIESKDELKGVSKLQEEFKAIKGTLVKYRDQLSEMAVFNSNLAGVNSILINEELALTNEDKKNIISKFNKVKTITESEKLYNNILSDMKTEKKSITESIEDKVSNTIDKSSSDKVIEKNGYVNEHVNKIKDMMKYVDGHGNKKLHS